MNFVQMTEKELILKGIEILCKEKKSRELWIVINDLEKKENNDFLIKCYTIIINTWREYTYNFLENKNDLFCYSFFELDDISIHVDTIKKYYINKTILLRYALQRKSLIAMNRIINNDYKLYTSIIDYKSLQISKLFFGDFNVSLADNILSILKYYESDTVLNILHYSPTRKKGLKIKRVAYFIRDIGSKKDEFKNTTSKMIYHLNNYDNDKIKLKNIIIENIKSLCDDVINICISYCTLHDIV